MYLAGILALCALLYVSASGRVRGELSSSEIASAHSFQSSPAQEPAKPDASPDLGTAQTQTRHSPLRRQQSLNLNAPAQASHDVPPLNSDQKNATSCREIC